MATKDFGLRVVTKATDGDVVLEDTTVITVDSVNTFKDVLMTAMGGQYRKYASSSPSFHIGHPSHAWNPKFMTRVSDSSMTIFRALVIAPDSIHMLVTVRLVAAPRPTAFARRYCGRFVLKYERFVLMIRDA